MEYQDDIKIAKERLTNLYTYWEGKQSILEMKDVNYNWKQMEWWGFFFELLCQRKLENFFSIPGDKYGIKHSACFDLRRTINWDLKAKAIQANNSNIILNDTIGTNQSLEKYGFHGLIVALCNVEYDTDRSFYTWHRILKDGKSKYEEKLDKERELDIEQKQKPSLSRDRKTKVDLQEISFLIINPKNVSLLDTYCQGRNSNNKSRNKKYMLNYDKNINEFLVDKIIF